MYTLCNTFEPTQSCQSKEDSSNIESIATEDDTAVL